MPDAANLDASAVARQELRLFLRTAEQIGMDIDRQCRSLRLSRDDLQRWMGVLHDAPLPPHPDVPSLLRHLGYLNNRLDRAARGSYA